MTNSWYHTWSLIRFIQFSLAIRNLNGFYFCSHLNTPDLLSGESPLMLAIKGQHLAIVKMLVAANASLEHLDHEANSVFHYAASTNKDIILVVGYYSVVSWKCHYYYRTLEPVRYYVQKTVYLIYVWACNKSGFILVGVNCRNSIMSTPSSCMDMMNQ